MGWLIKELFVTKVTRQKQAKREVVRTCRPVCCLFASIIPNFSNALLKKMVFMGNGMLKSVVTQL